ncbi:MAG: tetratricopeptide repeat protein [Candidatus Sulfotelmatobacter sp.]
MASRFFAFTILGLSVAVWAQQGSSTEHNSPGAAQRNSTPSTASDSNLAPPRSDRVQADDLGSEMGESSSKDTQIDLSPPADDSKTHPKSSAAVAEAETGVPNGASGITEFHTWDPHKAAKSIEVGDFYFRRKNYRAAEGRYRDALQYKDNDAVATIRLAVCLEKLGILDDARAEYESYLKILPHGPESAQAQKAIDRLKLQSGAKKTP